MIPSPDFFATFFTAVENSTTARYRESGDHVTGIALCVARLPNVAGLPPAVG